MPVLQRGLPPPWLPKEVKQQLSRVPCSRTRCRFPLLSGAREETTTVSTLSLGFLVGLSHIYTAAIPSCKYKTQAESSVAKSLCRCRSSGREQESHCNRHIQTQNKRRQTPKAFKCVAGGVFKKARKISQLFFLLLFKTVIFPVLSLKWG